MYWTEPSGSASGQPDWPATPTGAVIGRPVLPEISVPRGTLSGQSVPVPWRAVVRRGARPRRYPTVARTSPKKTLMLPVRTRDSPSRLWRETVDGREPRRRRKKFSLPRYVSTFHGNARLPPCCRTSCKVVALLEIYQMYPSYARRCWERPTRSLRRAGAATWSGAAQLARTLALYLTICPGRAFGPALEGPGLSVCKVAWPSHSMMMPLGPRVPCTIYASLIASSRSGGVHAEAATKCWWKERAPGGGGRSIR